jgi:hypothetical protein
VNRWKRHEREVAKLLGGERVPCTGRPAPDVLTDRWAVEVKTRKSLPAWMHHAMEQAIAQATDGRVPLVVLCEARQGSRTQRYALLRLDDLCTACAGGSNNDAN